MAGVLSLKEKVYTLFHAIACHTEIRMTDIQNMNSYGVWSFQTYLQCRKV